MERKASETVFVLQTLHDMFFNRFDVPENEAMVEKHRSTRLRLDEALRVAKEEAHLEKLDQDHFREIFNSTSAAIATFLGEVRPFVELDIESKGFR